MKSYAPSGSFPSVDALRIASDHADAMRMLRRAGRIEQPLYQSARTARRMEASIERKAKLARTSKFICEEVK